jgi:hypothetical protein
MGLRVLSRQPSSRIYAGDTADRIRERNYLIPPELSGAVPTVGVLGAVRTAGVVLLQVGTAFVVPTDGQEYDPTDGAVTVPTEVTDCP